MSDRDWTGAKCLEHDPELWYPTAKSGGNPDWDSPRAICSTCPLVAECLEWALTAEDPTGGHGMFGGLTPYQRTKVRRERGLKPALQPIRHGAPGEGGERAHRRRGEKPCRACMDASNLAKRLKERASA